MNKPNQLVLNQCVEDLKRIKHLLSAISDDEEKELNVVNNNPSLTGSQKWNKRERINNNQYHIQGSITGIYKAIGVLLQVH